MPEITITLSRPEALNLCQVIHVMKGEARYKAAREQLQSSVLSIWPELTDEADATPISIRRKVNLTDKMQRSMAEGILDMIKNPESPGKDVAALHVLGVSLGVWKWVAHHLDAIPFPEDDFKTDNEPELESEPS